MLPYEAYDKVSQGQREQVSLDEKLRYLREIENIHRLSKKVLPPPGTTWARIADKHLQKALGLPIKESAEPFNVQPSKHMHEHSPRTARVIERTLRCGMIHPDVLHSYRKDGVRPGKAKTFKEEPVLKHDDPDVVHYVLHGDDLPYPHGHMQGYGFVPRMQEAARHVRLEDSVRPVTDTVPTKGSVAGANVITQ